MRKTLTACAFILVGGTSLTAQAQHIPPYHGPGAQGQHSQGSRHGAGQGETFGPAGGRYIGGPTQSGMGQSGMGQVQPAAPSYWTYNRFSNNGFGGLNWYYGPLGGYTPYVTPYGSTTYGYPYFGPYYSYVPLAPVIRQTRPYWIGGDPFGNIANNNAGQQANGLGNPPAPGGQMGGGQPAQQPAQPNVKIFGKAPTTDALRRSIRYQAQGDEYFAKGNFLQAYGHYKQAITAAPTRPEPRFRMALALAATTNYSSAVEEIKRAMRFDPSWPQTGPQLDELFGAENILGKNAVLHKVAGWVREDIRDPDRLFLMGVLLHFNDDPDKSHTFFEASSAMATVPIYAQTFLEAEEEQRRNPRANRPVEEPRPAPPDDDAPLVGPAPLNPARVDPAGGQVGPRFPSAVAIEETERLLGHPAQIAQPGPVPRGDVRPDNLPLRNPSADPKAADPKAAGPKAAGPKASVPKIFRTAPAKAPEEPRPRPLAKTGANCSGSWA